MYSVDEDVLGLDVSVEDVAGVHVVDSLADLFDEGGNFGFLQILELEQVSIWHVLLEKVDLLFVMEETVERRQIVMIHEQLQFDFPTNLLFHVEGFYLAFEDSFDDADEVGSLLLYQKYITKSSFADLLDHFKIIH